MNTNIKYIFSAAAFMLSVGLTSCTGDLDVNPIDPNLKQVLCYHRNGW